MLYMKSIQCCWEIICLSCCACKDFVVIASEAKQSQGDHRDYLPAVGRLCHTSSRRQAFNSNVIGTAGRGLISQCALWKILILDTCYLILLFNHFTMRIHLLLYFLFEIPLLVHQNHDNPD